MISAGLILLMLLAYEPVRHNDFVYYDDEDYVTKNVEVQQGFTLVNVIWAFTAENNTANWHPLTWLSHMADVELFGLNPLGHHLHNLALHMLSVVLLFWLLQRMTGAAWRSAFAAMVFGIHPLHVESVAWAAERKDVLSALFFMLTLHAYVSYVRKRGALRYMLVALLFALGLMAKPMLVTLPLVLLILDVWPLQRIPQIAGEAVDGDDRSSLAVARGLIVEKLPLFILTLISCVVTFVVQRSGGAMIIEAPVSVRLLNTPINYITYITDMFWPAKLAVLYPYDLTPPVWKALAAFAVLLAITVAALWQLWQRPWLTAGWLWFGVMLVPVIGLVQVGLQSTADRYMYLPCIGIAMMVAWTAGQAVESWPRGKLALSVCGALLAAGMALGTRAQLAHWKDTNTLFEHTLAVTHDNYLAYNNLGAIRYHQGRLEEAEALFSRAIEIQPDFPSTYVDLAAVFSKQGLSEKAESYLRKALSIDPDHFFANNNLATLFLEQGRLDEAQVYLDKALQVKPESVAALMNLSTIYMQGEQYDKAMECMQKVTRLDPDNFLAYQRMGVIYQAWGRLDDAIAAYEDSVRYFPENGEGYNNLGVLKGQKASQAKTAEEHQALLDEAVECFQRSLEIDPNGVETYNNLGFALKIQGRFKEAVQNYRLACNVDPGNFDRHWNLGTALQTMGNREEAAECYRRTIALNPEFAPAMSNLAWILATHPTEALRDPSEAVALAEKAVELTSHEIPMALDSLAAAYASAGEFDQAAGTAQEAVERAEAANQPRMAGDIRSRLDLYQAGKPFYEKNSQD
ncbi:tetratricopeptide repeat protein [Candidatus Sumerlaeota bacterium]|nr:tetratricopeptide repeat protein [Candidatus Sumerlaeota bacterium]